MRIVISLNVPLSEINELAAKRKLKRERNRYLSRMSLRFMPAMEYQNVLVIQNLKSLNPNRMCIPENYTRMPQSVLRSKLRELGSCFTEEEFYVWLP